MMDKKEEKKKKRKHTTTILVVSSILVIVILMAILYTLLQSREPSLEVSQSLQQCINEKQLTIFTSPTCPHCVNMKEKLKEYENITWVDCTVMEEMCDEHGIFGVPSYGVVENDTLTVPYAGEVELEQLEDMLCPKKEEGETW